jgi:hypothetical protein
LNLETSEYFNRPATEVADKFAMRWTIHSESKTQKPEVHEGSGQLIALQNGNSVKLYIPRSVEVYSHDYTMGRWPNSRGVMINTMTPGDIVAFTFRASTLLFIKTQGAENIALQILSPADHNGRAVDDPKDTLTAAKIAPVLGMRHNTIGHTTWFPHNGLHPILFHFGQRVLGERERTEIEEGLVEGLEEELKDI